MAKVAAHAAGYGLLFGLLAYAGLYWGYNRFYSTIGLAPGDIGLGYNAILSSSALTLAIVGIPLLFYLANDFVKILLWFAVVVYGITLLLSIHFTSIPVGYRESSGFASQAWFDLNARVNKSRDDLYAGKRVDSVTLGGVTVFNYKAIPATLRASGASTQQTPAEDDPARLPCVLYLGDKDSQLVIYDPLRHHVLRVPSSNFNVVLDSRKSCSDKLPQRTRKSPVAKDGKGNLYVRAILRVDGRNYSILFPARSLLALRIAVETFMTSSATKAFRLTDGSFAVISFKGVTNVEIRPG